MKRRDVITLLGGAAGAWPLVAHAEQLVMPMIGVVGVGLDGRIDFFRRGLAEEGYVEGRNIRINTVGRKDMWNDIPNW